MDIWEKLEEAKKKEKKPLQVTSKDNKEELKKLIKKYERPVQKKKGKKSTYQILTKATRMRDKKVIKGMH